MQEGKMGPWALTLVGSEEMARLGMSMSGCLPSVKTETLTPGKSHAVVHP